MLPAVASSTPRLQGGRRPRRPVPVTPIVETLVTLVQERTPGDVAVWLQRYVGERIDEELELLATYFLAEAFDDIAMAPEVQALITRGRQVEAVRTALSRARRRTAKTLRDHQRSDDDAFLDSCVQD